MKKVFFLLSSMIMVGNMFAQIEEFDASSFKEHDQSPQNAPREVFFDNYSYPINLSKQSSHYSIKDYRPYNLLGHKLYLVNDLVEVEVGYYKFTFNLFVVTLSKENVLGIEKVTKGKYYEVVDVAILEEEKKAIYSKLQTANDFISEQIPYVEIKRNTFFNATIKKEKIYSFSKNQAIYLLKSVSDENPNIDIVSYQNYRKTSRICAIYVLKDEDNKLYYVPGRIVENGIVRAKLTDPNISGGISEDYYKRVQKSEGSLLLGYGISIADFISVDSYDFYKNKYVGKELVSDSYIDYRNEDERRYKKDSDLTYLAEKLSLKDSKMVLTIYNRAKDIRRVVEIYDYDKMSAKARNSQIHKNDSVYILKGSGDYVYYLILRTEADSLRYKWEQEELQKEREKLAQDEAKRRELINKYGEKNAEYITEGKVCVGMNNEMCREAMGSPDNISKSTNALGEIEQWTYSLGYRYFHGLIPITIVTFVNGEVTSVDEVRENSLL